jgi:CheY-like chemotaxis protein
MHVVERTATPLWSPSNEERATDVTTGAGTSLAATQQVAGTVLVVEDDAANRALLTHLLETEGFRVHAIADGEAGVAAVATVDPDLVLLDVGLPGLDGYELTRRLRLDPRHVTLPILLLTGRTLPSDVVTGLNAGADDLAGTTPRIVIISASVLPAERTQALASGADAFLGKPFGAGDLVDLLAGLAEGVAGPAGA